MKLTYKGRGRGPRGPKRGVGVEIERARRYPKGYSNPDRRAERAGAGPIAPRFLCLACALPVDNVRSLL